VKRREIGRERESTGMFALPPFLPNLAKKSVPDCHVTTIVIYNTK